MRELAGLMYFAIFGIAVLVVVVASGPILLLSLFGASGWAIWAGWTWAVLVAVCVLTFLWSIIRT